jgi:hypothetical protein
MSIPRGGLEPNHIRVVKIAGIVCGAEPHRHHWLNYDDAAWHGYLERDPCCQTCPNQLMCLDDAPFLRGVVTWFVDGGGDYDG